jgi:hypothetical protein
MSRVVGGWRLAGRVVGGWRCRRCNENIHFFPFQFYFVDDALDLLPFRLGIPLFLADCLQTEGNVVLGLRNLLLFLPSCRRSQFERPFNSLLQVCMERVHRCCCRCCRGSFSGCLVGVVGVDVVRTSLLVNGSLVNESFPEFRLGFGL